MALQHARQLWRAFSPSGERHNRLRATVVLFIRGKDQHKTAGIIILIVGLLMTLYTGFTYFTKEKVVDLGELERTKDNQHTVNWQPYIGIGVMVVGGAVLILGRKRNE